MNSRCQTLPYKAIRYYLLTLQVSRYCLLALHGSTHCKCLHRCDIKIWLLDNLHSGVYSVFICDFTVTNKYQNFFQSWIYMERFDILFSSRFNLHASCIATKPSKHDTWIRCWINVGPASQTLAQHWSNIVSMCRVCWKVTSYVNITVQLYLGGYPMYKLIMHPISYPKMQKRNLSVL